jgi:hypothetical protein
MGFLATIIKLGPHMWGEIVEKVSVLAGLAKYVSFFRQVPRFLLEEDG